MADPTLYTGGAALAAINPVQSLNDYAVSWLPWAYYAMDAAAFDGSGNFPLPDLSGSGNDEVLGSSNFKVADPGGQTLVAGSPASPSAHFITSNYPEQLAHDPGLFHDPLFAHTSVVMRVASEYQDAILMGVYHVFYNAPIWELAIIGGKVAFTYATETPSSSTVHPSVQTLSTASLASGTAHTIGFSADDDNVYLYIDGALDTTIPITGVSHDNYPGLGGNIPSTNIIYMLGAAGGAATNAFFGNMSSLGLYPQTLPASAHHNFHTLATSADALIAEDTPIPTKWGEGDPAAAAVTGTYGQEVLASSPLVYYRLGEAVGNEIMRDSSGNGHDGSLDLANRDYYGFIPYVGYVSPTPGQDSLDPTDAANTATQYGYQALSQAIVAGGPTSTSWTLELLLKPGAFNTQKKWVAQANFRASSNVAASATGSIGIAVEGTKVHGYINDPNNVSGDYSGEFRVTVDDQAGGADTYHYAVVLDGTTLKLYVSGVLVGSADATAAIAAGWATAPLDDLNIGQKSVMTPYSGPDLGVVDEVSLYPTALDDATLASHFSTLGLAEPTPYTPPPPVLPPVRGKLFTEDFDGGAVGDAPTTDNTTFTAITDGANAAFIADGQDGQGLGRMAGAADGSSSLSFADTYKTNPLFYYRTLAKFSAPDVVSGSSFAANVLTDGVYINEQYLGYYPNGFVAATFQIKGKGGALGNDTFAGAEPLEVGVESAISQIATGANYRWYRYTPSTDGTLVIVGVDHGTDIVLEMGTGADEASFVVLTSDDDSAGASQPKITQAVTSGTEYHFRVHGYGAGPGSLLIQSGPVANNAAAGGGAADPVTFDWVIGVSDNTGVLQPTTVCAGEQDTWYIVEIEHDANASAVNGRISSMDGTVLGESGPVAVIDQSAVGAVGPTNPIGLTTYVTSQGTSSVVVDGAAISDTDWVGTGAVVAASIPVKVWDGASETEIASVGWWDGAAVQPVAVKGWYDGAEVGGLT